MTETAQFQRPGLTGADFRSMLLRGEIALAFGVLGILAIMLVPLPPVLLDFLLAISITLSLLVLVTALLIKRPLEFTSFPTVLLLATLLRLALNIASTRLILSNGQSGEHAAGDVIAAFAQFVMGGEFVIGVIVFAILVIVNFVVITRGSTRIAEVAARFTLDAMPGKQMAIDADLSSGLINDTQARERRRALEDESAFFGAMDGASKFVRGDAIAGLLIVFINIIGGIIIGVFQHGMAFEEAGKTYTLLTVGDGLVTQIPALIVSVAAGMLVTKAGINGAADKALATQFASYPVGLGVVAACAFGVGVLPGMPLIPFWVLAGASGLLAWRLREATRIAAVAAATPAAAEPAEETSASSLAMDNVRIDLGFGLLSLINDVQGRRLTDQVKVLRKTLAQEYGFIMPDVRIMDDMTLASDRYTVRVREMIAGEGTLKIGALLAMDPSGIGVKLRGEAVKEPAFGLDAAWIDEAAREEASFHGYTVVDPATVLATHLTEIIKEHMSELLTFAEVKKLIKDLPKETQSLLDDVAPDDACRLLDQRDCGLPLRAVEAILRGDVEHAFHPGGGLHHAMPDRASGFCIYDDPALAMLAEIVHGADVTTDLRGRPEAEGLKAIAEGFRHLGLRDDHEILAREAIVYDALYGYCREMVRRGKPNGQFH